MVVLVLAIIMVYIYIVRNSYIYTINKTSTTLPKSVTAEARVRHPPSHAILGIYIYILYINNGNYVAVTMDVKFQS
jgi:uncharacterized membrane protein YobD (UPF0266 family)